TALSRQVLQRKCVRQVETNRPAHPCEKYSDRADRCRLRRPLHEKFSRSHRDLRLLLDEPSHHRLRASHAARAASFCSARHDPSTDCPRFWITRRTSPIDFLSRAAASSYASRSVRTTERTRF